MPIKPDVSKIGAATPTFWNLLQRTISNGTLGQNFVRAHPQWAENIGIRPTEDPGDPGYEEHSGEMLPLDLMLPHPQSLAAHRLHGILRETAKLTTPEAVMQWLLMRPLLGPAGAALPAGIRVAALLTSMAQAAPSVYRAVQSSLHGNANEAAESQGEAVPNLIMAGLSLPEAVEHAQGMWPELKGLVAPPSVLDKPSVEGISPRQIYEAAKEHGVDLDAAQATGGKALVPRVAKFLTEHSLFGSGSYSENNERNISALADWAAAAQDAASPTEMSRENFGNAANTALKAHQENLMDRSGALFDQLSKDVGGTQPDTSGVRDTAQGIIDDNKTYYANHPELRKGGAGQAWAIAQDLAGASVKPKANVSAIVDPVRQTV